MSPTPDPHEGDITRLLSESAEGSRSARDRLVEIVYAELHAMARARLKGERSDHTLGATGLVNETYLRLFRVAWVEPTPWVSSTRKSVASAWLARSRRTIAPIADFAPHVDSIKARRVSLGLSIASAKIALARDQSTCSAVVASLVSLFDILLAVRSRITGLARVRPGRGQPVSSSLIASRSHARANSQSRFTVRSETSSI